MQTSGRIDTRALKQQTDLVELAGRYTALRRIAAREYAGPCPKCGGVDRFHVKSAGWFCRHCHSLEEYGWSDAIELVRWREGVGFQEACARLAGSHTWTSATAKARPAPGAPQPARHRPGWATMAGALADRAREALWTPGGEPGRAYLRRRGLEEHTWLAYRMGYLDKTPTSEGAAAIVLPWQRGGRLAAVRFRFLDPPSDTKIKSLAGSKFAELAYGGQALEPGLCTPSRSALAGRTLVLVEGELNCASVWQAARGTRLDVLSVGSESATPSHALIRYAAQYGTVLTWLDKSERATAIAAALPGAHAIASPRGKDANDWLQERLLGGLLSAARLRACRSRADRERLFQILWSAAGAQGVDGGTAQIIERVAGELDRAASLCEGEPDRWLAEQKSI